MVATSPAEAAVARWHDAVNDRDLEAARSAVTDPVVVNGPKGAATITPDGFADWILRSGLSVEARSWHPVTDRVLVVEQDARWPQSPDRAQVATVFRVSGDRVSAALRFADLPAAIDFAVLYPALAATEQAGTA
jgi:hypothetical protein